MEPVSSHAPPLPIISAESFLPNKYFLSKSVISSSFLLEGFKFLAYLMTLLSK